MSVNSKRTGSLAKEKHQRFVVDKSHKNFMRGESYDIGNPIYNLRLAGSSCFFGEPMYYGKGSKTASRSTLVGWVGLHLRSTLGAIDPVEWHTLSPSEMLESAIDKALDFNPEATLREAVRLRTEDNIRTTPQVILVRAANHPKVRGTQLVGKYAPHICLRADEPAVCMAYQIERFGRKGIPNSLKRALRNVLSSFSDYQLAKYKMESRSVKTVDVVNLVHPSSPSVDKLVKNELKLTDDNATWESLRSAGRTWEECIPVMGHMALLRNLRNFAQSKVDYNLYLDKLVEGVPSGKQLPFRYFTAFKAVEDIAKPQVLDALDKCMSLSLDNVPQFAGRTMSLCDNSGSAQGTFTSEFGSVKVSEIANLSAILTGQNSEEGYIGVFGDRLEVQSIRKSSSVFDCLAKANKAAEKIGQGTENGVWLFFKNAIKNSEHWDNIFIYSDMQAGHGGLYGTNPREYEKYLWGRGVTPSERLAHMDVASLVMDYRARVNKNVNVFLVQVAGYQDTIIPEFYDRTYILGGWSGGLLKFAASMIKRELPKQ